MKKEEKHIENKFNILIYSDEMIMYYTGVPTEINIENDYSEPCWDIYGRMQNPTLTGAELRARIYNFEKLDNIKLDDTTMKRIALYNKSQECQKLEEEIKSKQKEIQRLDDLLLDKGERWQKVKEYISDIYDLDLDGEDDGDYEYE